MTKKTGISDIASNKITYNYLTRDRVQAKDNCSNNKQNWEEISHFIFIWNFILNGIVVSWINKN